MPRPIVLARSHHRAQTARRVNPAATLSRTIARATVAMPTRRHHPAAPPSSAPSGFQPDPYLDYGRFLTPEGGIQFVYKDVDERFRHTLWRLFAWIAFTFVEGYFLYHGSPLRSPLLNIACFIAVAFVNWHIVQQPVQMYCAIEIRPDALIIGGQEIFWQRFMESGPTFRPDPNGGQTLCGIYGTRFVEFLTVRRFDEYDRTPEIFAAHLQDAVKQLWTGLY